MKKERSSRMDLLAVLAAFLYAASPTASQSIQMIGYDISKVTGEGTKVDTLKGKVLLLYNEVQSPGIFFAFSVLFDSTNPAIFQLYRPVDDTKKNYRLLAQFNVTPSVAKGREDIYIESFLNRRCIAVEPGDRMAIYVTDNAVSIQSQFNATGNMILGNPADPPSIGAVIPFDTVSYPRSIWMAGYYIVSNVSSLSFNSSFSIADVDCRLGLMIPEAIKPTLSTTTALPITGAPGETGATGPMGVIGMTGQQGQPGETGPNGNIGSPGSTGLTGDKGPKGAIGVVGSMGYTGWTGAIGDTGPSENGDTGSTGPHGPPGLMGINFTIFLHRPEVPNQGQLLEKSDTSDPYWSSSRAIWATYIWLAIVSFILLIVIVIIVVIIILHNSISRPKQSSPKAAQSTTNILEDTPCNYSDLADQ